MRACSETAHMPVVEFLPVGKALGVTPCGQRLQVALVGTARVGRQPPLMGQVTREALTRLKRGGFHRGPVLVAGECIAYQFAQLREEVRAHARVKALAVMTAQCQQAQRHIADQRHQGHRAHAA